MSRSLKHMLGVVEKLETMNVKFVSLRENIDATTATGRCFLSLMGAIVQMERELRAERAAAGRTSAEARGRTGGRPRTDPQKLEKLGFCMKIRTCLLLKLQRPPKLDEELCFPI